MKSTLNILLPVVAAIALVLMYNGNWMGFETRGGEMYMLGAAGFVSDHGIPVADVQPYFNLSLIVGMNALLYLASLLFVNNARRRAAVLQVALMLSVGVMAFSFISANSFVGYLGGALKVNVTRTWLFFLPMASFVTGLVHYRAVSRA
jgi:hypothetical protein